MCAGLGFSKDLLGKIGLCGVATDKSNACRRLHAIINKTPGVTLNLPLDMCEIPIRLKRPVRIKKVWWPYLRVETWLSFMLKEHPKLLLGGCSMEGREYEAVFTSFWNDYRRVDPSHPVFSSSIPLTHAVPYMLHGDEGRGANKIPFLVMSWQPVIGHRGLEYCNDTSLLGSYVS